MAREAATSLFAYRALDVEIRAKHRSGLMSANALAPLVWRQLAGAGLDAGVLQRVQALWDALTEADFDKVYPNYLCHPLRVAASLARHSEYLSAETVTLALCHNFREAMEDRALDPALREIEREYLSDWTRGALNVLYTDRKRERDPAYLQAYYAGIVGAGDPAVALKGLDKLDNHLSYAFETVDPYHHLVVTDYVVPLLAPRVPRLAGYLEELVRYVSDPAVIERFRAEATACETGLSA